MNEQAVQRAVMEQIRCSARLRQQIGRQVAEVMTTGRASTRITIRVPVPIEAVSKPVFRANENRNKRRFVLNAKTDKGLAK